MEVSFCCMFCNNSPKTSTDSTSVTKFLQQLDLSFSSSPEYSMCQDCLSGVSKATKWRDQVEEVERDVRSLQRIILKMMHQLKTLQTSYFGEMTRLESKIRRSKAISRRSGGINASKERDAVRQAVVKVIKELRVAQTDLSVHLLTDIKSPFAPPLPDPEAILQDNNRMDTEEALVKVEPELDDVDSEPIILETVHSPQENSTDDPLSNANDIYIPPSEPRNSSPAEPQDEASDNDSNDSDYNPDDRNTTSDPQHSPSSPLPPEGPPSPSYRHGPCAHCGKYFKASHHLRNHLFTHTTNRPFKCPQCPKTFCQLGGLRRHEVNHVTHKPFQCTLCPQSFARRDYLEEHRRRHTGEKPFGCPYPACNKRFIQRNHVKHHLQSQHPDFSV